MKNIVLSLFLLFSAAVSAQQVPDGPFLDVLLTAYSTNNIATDSDGNPIAIDTDLDGEITAEEAAVVYILNVSGNNLSSLEGIEYFTNMISLVCHTNEITALDLSGLPQLTYVDCHQNNLTSLNVSGLINLEELLCQQNALVAVDFTGLTALGGLDCSNNLFESIDVSTCTSLIEFACQSNNITTLFLKNGQTEVSSAEDDWWVENPLVYICADEFQIAGLEATFPNTVQINSYCTYEPGGTYNTITGHVTYDADNNGCGALDFTAPSVKIKISDGAFEDTVFSDADGNYTFYIGQVGDYTITPVFENSYFSFEEPIVTIPNIDGSSVTQDLCIAPNGAYSDIEVVIAPVTTAQPGFDAVYKMVYKNKGTQFLSGEVTCGWDSSLLSFVNAEPFFNDFGPNTYTWYYDNLQPFEIREIYMTLEVNAPGDTPPVNVGDVLPFTITGTPGADANPDDNFFAFDQEVVGSYDPNNIVCIEGEMEAPDAIGEYLHYIVNFENTGTAPTSFVVVTYELDPDDFDVDTVQLIDSSHEVQVRAQGNSFEFMFDNLTLGVADHGNILFKVKSKGSLMAGDEVASQANIYFDYNFPVLTNEAVTTYAILGTDDFTADNTIKMYPNPVKDAVTIAGDYDLTTIELYDIQGRLLQTAIVNSTTATIDMAKRAAGVYFIKAASGKGVKVEKLVKE